MGDSGFRTYDLSGKRRQAADEASAEPQEERREGEGGETADSVRAESEETAPPRSNRESPAPDRALPDAAQREVLERNAQYAKLANLQDQASKDLVERMFREGVTPANLRTLGELPTHLGPNHPDLHRLFQFAYLSTDDTKQDRPQIDAYQEAREIWDTLRNQHDKDRAQGQAHARKPGVKGHGPDDSSSGGFLWVIGAMAAVGFVAFLIREVDRLSVPTDSLTIETRVSRGITPRKIRHQNSVFAASMENATQNILYMLEPNSDEVREFLRTLCPTAVANESLLADVTRCSATHQFEEDGAVTNTAARCMDKNGAVSVEIQLTQSRHSRDESGKWARTWIYRDGGIEEEKVSQKVDHVFVLNECRVSGKSEGAP